MRVLIEAQYLAPVAYFSALQQAREIIVEKHEHFVKQTYRNRCHVVSAHGMQSLTVPLTSKHGKAVITDVRIDYSQKWLNNHWRTIQSAYGKAPFFEYYAGDLERVLFKKPAFLYELNVELLSLCLKWLRFNVTIRESPAYENIAEPGVLDLRSIIKPKNNQNLDFFFQAVPYHQVFGNPFAANASIIDLIFCAGPGALQVVRESFVAK